MVSELQFIAAEQRFAEFMILFHESPPTAPVIRMQSLELDFFSPGHIPQPNPEAMSQSVPGMNQDCACAMPLFSSRTAWSCPDGDQASCASPAFSTVSHLIIHHSAGSNTSANWAATVLSIWNYHVNINGWCDIGYNWLIDPLGNVYQGRGGGNNVVGAHFCGQNSGTMGICMLGNYESASPGEAALRSLARLLAWKACDAEVSPSDTSLQSSSGLMLPVVSGHQHGCNTLCPGTNLWSLLPAIRQESDSLLNLCNMVQGNSPEIQVHPLGVYPNPAGDQLYLVLPAGQMVQDIRVFTPEGQEVMRFRDSFRGTVAIDLSTLLPGLYLLEAAGKGQLFTGKVQVIR
ncbi:MAG: T9SS C-terminal target domain-containing protein [Bacteroidetes bacterium]|nr:MAG: T9SS C-terminal target domain-containing protein [Bacteroidota bacterium]